MRSQTIRVRSVLSVCAILAAAPAVAQVYFDGGGIVEKKGAKGLPEVKPSPQAWPRLDPGAAFCRSRDDLDRLAANRARTEGAGRADCQMIRVPTAVTVIQRDGPGHTLVKITDSNASGWTDVWLPEKAPGRQAR